MWRRRDSLKQNDIQVFLFTFDRLELAQEYAAESEWDWPLLLDRERQIYDQYTKGRGSFAAIAGPISIYKYVKLLLAGQKLQKGGEDYFQLGGDVIIGSDRKIQMHHISQDPHDRPDIDQVLSQLKPTYPEKDER